MNTMKKIKHDVIVDMIDIIQGRCSREASWRR